MDSSVHTSFDKFHENGMPLTAVKGSFWTYPDEPGPDALGVLQLQFDKESVYLAVEGDDDTLIVGVCPRWINDADLVGHNLSNQEPWRKAIGKPLLWSWTMIDRTEFFDGIQLEFAENVEDESVIVQLIRMPAELAVREVGSEFVKFYF